MRLQGSGVAGREVAEREAVATVAATAEEETAGEMAEGWVVAAKAAG